jgi:hypothetical protein
MGRQTDDAEPPPAVPFFLEAIVFAPQEAVLMEGWLSDGPAGADSNTGSSSKGGSKAAATRVNSIGWWFKPWFYKHVRACVRGRRRRCRRGGGPVCHRPTAWRIRRWSCAFSPGASAERPLPAVVFGAVDSASTPPHQARTHPALTNTDPASPLSAPPLSPSPPLPFLRPRPAATGAEHAAAPARGGGV